MNASVAERADSQHPWIGLASFTEGDREFFAGRGDEIDDLLRLVRRDTLTLLYGVSGLGKTSLVQAGLFPALREDNVLPVPIRLDYLEDAAPLAGQIISAITAAAVAARVEAPQPRPDETLWEYFHREGNHFWSPRNDLVTPFLAFDQFEEFFTLGRETPARVARAATFIAELADLVENRPPAALRDDPLRVKEFNFKPAPLKVLLAMREDYLADLDRIRSHFRALGQNRLRLLPMGERQARQVIALGAQLLAPGVEDRIVHYVAGGAADADEMTVAPALLSLVLRELNERRLARGPEAKITPDLLDVEQHKIFEDFYLRTLEDFPASVRLFIEDELLTASGHRNSCALDDALTRPDVTPTVLNELVNRRLLAYEDRHNTRRVELTHDVLVPVIKASRDSRLTREALAQAERLRAEQVAQKRKQRLTQIVAGALALTLIATIWGGYYAFIQEHKAYYRFFAKRHGFPVGVGQVSESEARRLSTSYLLIHKGITSDGWRPRWKPAFRMIAMNGLLEPTTRHGVTTYLWGGDSESDTGQGTRPSEKGQRLGLQTICQWEFVSTAKGEIIYERGLDRDARMVYGLIYSPPGSGGPDMRLARFVGPDGFPQLQRSSAAEYVSIHYDKEGWEDRISYRDGKDLPASGPDGAFGQLRSHNSRGQTTLLLSLDADGKNMIDNAGNCGIREIYNERGLNVEEQSLGPDLKPLPVKEGWAIAKHQYDEFGRWRRGTYHDSDGEPVLRKEGFHAYEVQLDEHGNESSKTWIGLDGRPIALPDGYAMTKSAYDARGNLTRESYYGVAEEPVRYKEGYQAWEAQHDPRGNQTALTYFGLDGKPILRPNGFAIIRYEYDARDRVIRMRLYGVNGEPVTHKEGHHGWTAFYDERGNRTAGTFLGLDGQLALLPDGYAAFRKKFDSDGNELEVAYFDAEENPTSYGDSGVHKFVSIYDARGKETRVSFYGVNGEPVLNKSGFQAWEGQYDERGNQVGVSYFGVDGRAALLTEGYAKTSSVFDARGKVTRKSYYGVNWEPVLHKDGIHALETEYDERGNQTKATFIGLTGKPKVLPEKGYATAISLYDTRGQAARQSYLGVNGEPVLHKDGYHAWAGEYDERGNTIAETYFGVDGKVQLHPEGFATARMAYDARGKVIRMTLYGVKNEPVLSKYGFHGWDVQYDDQGNQTVQVYSGLDEKPVTRTEGYATIRSVYDARGKITRQSCYGVDGEAALDSKRYHAWEAQYDDHGNKIAITYFGLDEKPVLLPEVYATLKSDYDSRGHETQRGCYGLDGGPILQEDGYHAWKARYDHYGNLIETTFVGLDGKPTTLDAGFASVRMAYDSHGWVTQKSFWDAAGVPAVSNNGGCYGLQTQYDARGNPTETVFLGRDGKPAFNPLFEYAIQKLDPHRRATPASFWSADGALVMGPAGYAEVRRQWSEEETLVQEAFFGARGEPVRGEGGYHRMANIPGSVAGAVYYDVNNKELRSLGPDELVPLLFVERVTGLKEPAARAGVHPGDIPWRYGGWSLAELWQRERESGSTRDEITEKIRQALYAERDRLSDGPVPFTVFRQGQTALVVMPALPAKTFGVVLSVRSVPIAVYEAMKKDEARKSADLSSRVPAR